MAQKVEVIENPCVSKLGWFVLTRSICSSRRRQSLVSWREDVKVFFCWGGVLEIEGDSKMYVMVILDSRRGEWPASLPSPSNALQYYLWGGILY